MKRMMTILMVTCLLFITTACGQSNLDSSAPTSDTANQETVSEQTQPTEQEVPSQTEQTEPSSGTEKSTLIVYYSYSGNTEKAAAMIQEKTGGDIYKIETVREYPSDGGKVSDEAAIERETGNLPELKGELPDISQYDRIYVGGPVWTYTVSTPVMSFLEQVDFQGKEVLPFWTDAGSPGDYEQDFAAQAQNAQVQQGLGLSHVDDMEETELNDILDQWIKNDTNTEIGGSETSMTIVWNGKEYAVQTEDNITAKDIMEQMPLELSMTQFGEHEYYSELDFRPELANDKTTQIKAGHIYYWEGWNAFVINYIDWDIAPYEVVHIGEITDKSIVDELLKTNGDITVTVR